jgi:formylglycine-generating enzyme required for sulfatase activity
MAGKTFVNYRRDDSAPHALSIAQYLEREFGSRGVFLDIDRVRPGERFPKVLEERLNESRVMLVIIGPSWLTAANEAGQRRLDNPEDWVRVEIARALARGIPVIPVLVGGASLPRRSDLPEDLQPLVDHQVATITTNGFRTEMAGLARDLRDILRPRSRWPLAAGAAAAMVATVGLVLYLWGYPLSRVAALIMPDTAARSEAPASQDAATADAARQQKEAEAAAEERRKAIQAEQRRMALLQEQEVEKKRAEETERFAPGRVFRDCSDCPEMVVIPPGTFTMGSWGNETGRDDDESPGHSVTIRRPFAVGKYEVTFSEWGACNADGACHTNPNDLHGWGKGQRPVMNVSWNDAQEYVGWLSRTTGKTYRLPTEAEWEYAARAGASTRYSFGDDDAQTDICKFANVDDLTGQTERLYFMADCKDGYYQRSAPVGSFKPNAFGLYDMHGNVWEWVEDCYHWRYVNAPALEAAWDSECGSETTRVLRGGSWSDSPTEARSASRSEKPPTYTGSDLGFRVARDLTQ